MTKNDDEHSLADTPATTEESPALDAKTFDFAAFVAGIRPARRSVRIYPRRDLEAARDVLDQDIRDARDTGDRERAKSLEADRTSIVEEMNEGALDVVVEARSSEVRSKLLDALTKDGIEDEQERVLLMAHAQIAEPEGLTVDVLRAIQQQLEGQYAKIIKAVMDANGDAGPVTPDFSQGRSATTRK